jgi:hypothetical protein
LTPNIGAAILSLVVRNHRTTEEGSMRKIADWFRIFGLAALPLLVIVMSATAQDAAQLPPERKVALKTTTGYYITAENGGGSGVNTDRTELGPWETFTMVAVSPGVFAFRTAEGAYLTDLAAEQRGRRMARTSLGANRNTMDASTHFKVMMLGVDGPMVALVTSSGKYVTAENNGGVKARGARAISTDRSEIGAWEQFVLVDVDKLAKP